MEDRRKLERFDLHVPVVAFIESQNGNEEVLDLKVKDVSSDGAYLLSPCLLPEGAVVRMKFMISSNSISTSSTKNGKARVRVTGKVIRTDGNGAAVRFGNRYSISMSGSGAQRKYPR